MTTRWLRGASLAVPALTLACWIVVLSSPSVQGGSRLIDVIWALPYIAFPIVGAIIIHRRPAGRVGWILSGIGLAMGLAGVQLQALRLLYASSSSWHGLVPGLTAVLPFGPIAFGLIVTLVLTFPDGRLPSHRWRWLVAVLFAFLGLVIVDQAVSPAPPVPGLPPSGLANRDLARVLDPLTSFDLNGVFLLAAALGLVLRFRSADVVARRQIKWFSISVAALVACAIAGGIADAVDNLTDVQNVLQSAGLLLFAVGIGVAVVRHHLYDVDLVISRGLTYTALAALTTLVYVAFVVGIGALVGRTAGANLILSIAATALVAVAFHPLQVRLQDAANRLVYGRRQTPYESLAGFTRRLAADHAEDGILQRMADTLAAGVRARAAAVYLIEGNRETAAATSPAASALPGSPPSSSLEVRYLGESLGSLAVWTHDDQALNATEARLLSDLAVQAGLLLHNARLAVELEHRLDELRASRRRLVAAQDDERRRLERDLHDGAQHDLVALRMKLGLAEGEAAASGSRLGTLIAEMRDETAAALENIRQLSRGLYPPLLESQGLAAALTAHARRLPMQVDVRAGGDRFRREIETAVYFCCVEALQNAVKHAAADRAWIVIESRGAHLRFEIGDDGRGFDPKAGGNGSGLQNMTDRIEALGGSVSIDSSVAGTRIRGELEAEPQASATRRAASLGARTTAPAMGSVRTPRP
jgi:signal transduction histidine kinase